MKVTKKASKAIKGPFVAIGNRGTAIAQMETLEGTLTLGKNLVLAKTGNGSSIEDRKEELWARSCSWIQSRKEVDKNGNAYFTLLRVKDAIARGEVAVVKNIKFRQTATGKLFTGTLLAPKGYKSGEKLPANVAVIDSPGYKYGRIEKNMVKEADGSDSRNRLLVCKLVNSKK